jgi:hypothetical protein
MRAVVVVALLAGCWTGGETRAAETTMSNHSAGDTDAPDFVLSVTTTPCDTGECPIYSFVVHGDGRVRWMGKAHVASIGRRDRRIASGAIAQLQQLVQVARFFDRDATGQLPLEPHCTTVNGTTNCEVSGSFSLCNGTSHTIMTVRQEGREHTFEALNCQADGDIPHLQESIERIAGVREWVAR